MVTSATPSNAPVLVLSQREDYIQSPVAQLAKLDRMTKKLDMVLLALKALTDISADTIVRIASKLNIPAKVADEIAVVLREDISAKRGRSLNQPPKLDIAQSKVLIICHLAKQNQALIRRAVALMEQITAQNQKPKSVTLLREYIWNFKEVSQKYQFNQVNQENMSQETPEEIALKLLVDLLFYSAPQGCNRLWSKLKS
ncbi:MAG: DUF3038 domain-containing protein [Microcoleaceae cyanobacterium MO_207.B10]|nr:DUF3038 domain-containing protein [Microcoleaceae cyanobacterium MO_207.B10]